MTMHLTLSQKNFFYEMSQAIAGILYNKVSPLLFMDKQAQAKVESPLISLIFAKKKLSPT